MPRASPHRRHTIASRPSPRDKAALIYLFTERDGTIAKIGRTNDIERRRKEWARKCYPEPQTWVCRWRVPYGAKFEVLVHAHYKDAGTWIRPKPCALRRCRVKHREKFDFAACGGLAGVERAVDDLLRKLGWVSKQIDLERVWVILPAYPPRSAHLALKRTQETPTEQCRPRPHGVRNYRLAPSRLPWTCRLVDRLLEPESVDETLQDREGRTARDVCSACLRRLSDLPQCLISQSYILSPTPSGSSASRRGRVRACFIRLVSFATMVGHQAANCPRLGRLPGELDYKCGLDSNVSRDCTMEAKPNACDKCGLDGHIYAPRRRRPAFPFDNDPAAVFVSVLFLARAECHAILQTPLRHRYARTAIHPYCQLSTSRTAVRTQRNAENVSGHQYFASDPFIVEWYTLAEGTHAMAEQRFKALADLSELGANLDDLLSNANSTLSSPLLGRACIYIKSQATRIRPSPPTAHTDRHPRPPSADSAQKKPSASPTTPNHPSTPSGTTGTSAERRMTRSRPESVRESRSRLARQEMTQARDPAHLQSSPPPFRALFVYLYADNF
ncbi:hypothetical protein C8F01DRAFT_1348127 [Mycena amicta]|nr:hypothetical protein C8F01DRAFT_1348127 [Mycena amicta]